MVNVTAADVKTLRERTGAGLMDCKNSLEKCNNNMEEAIDWLRKKGLSAAASKAGRIAADGLVGARVDGTTGSVVEINSETDFVARNEKFQKYAQEVLDLVCGSGLGVDSLKAAAHPERNHSVQDELSSLIGIIGENLSIRRVAHLTVSQGVVACYVHNRVSPHLGKKAVLVGLESAGDRTKLLEFGKQLAMHILATDSRSVSLEDLDPELVAREKAIVQEQVQQAGKAQFADKIVEGRMRKFYEEVVLLEQTSALDGETKIKDLIAKTSGELGAPISVSGFVRYVLGEGIEKQATNFAAEVAAQLN
ncbi:MAG: translation elongation factor Ts [Holosporaceae bacterium]|jgi:elongation factor Ts|nr:translation elongation factor Ts [Holosporaceae bacterium]